ncbi:helix-turn-helix domain-containing protein [Kribbella sp. NPDC026596]|uniref:helix-turn-helix transcriptional regulator n=1 Tax=Kribbella sp. NPDC026596 TaxID=3155122 RepID=UPI0033C2404E
MRSRGSGAEATIRAVSVLSDDTRRRMFDFCRRGGRAISRDEAAAEVGISRKLAAFHLERLVDAGLLRTHYERSGGIRKVGRAPKMYEPAETELQVSIPPRRPDLLAEILLDGILSQDDNADGDAEAPDGGSGGLEAARRAAFRHGERVGAEERARSRPGRLSAERALTVSEATLASVGFEPTRPRPGCVRLHSCPFHPLAESQPDAVCGLNHAFLTGMLSGLRATTVHAVLDPKGGECCVEITAD